VFDDEGNGANWSDILDAVRWAQSKGAKLINMSLGTSTSLTTADNVYKQVFEQGSIVVSAAGNDGTSDKSYPAR